mgnify:CR=1 FL=1
MINFKWYSATFITLLFTSNINAEVIHSERSLYKNVIVEDDYNIRCLKFSVKRKTSSQSCVNKDQPKALVFSYTKLLFSSFLIMDKPENVLIINATPVENENSILFHLREVGNKQITFLPKTTFGERVTWFSANVLGEKRRKFNNLK